MIRPKVRRVLGGRRCALGGDGLSGLRKRNELRRPEAAQTGIQLQSSAEGSANQTDRAYFALPQHEVVAVVAVVVEKDQVIPGQFEPLRPRLAHEPELILALGGMAKLVQARLIRRLFPDETVKLLFRIHLRIRRVRLSRGFRFPLDRSDMMDTTTADDQTQGHCNDVLHTPPI